MAIFNYADITPAVISAADKKPGHSDVILIAPTGWFASIAEIVGTATPGDSKKITDAHTFNAGKGFVKIQAKPKSVDPTGDAQGEAGGQVPTYKYKFGVKGDSAVILEFLENLLNEDVIALFNSPQCGIDEYVQIGGTCGPAQVSGFGYKGGSRGAGGFKEYELTLESDQKFFYGGTVTLKP